MLKYCQLNFMPDQTACTSLWINSHKYLYVRVNINVETRSHTLQYLKSRPVRAINICCPLQNRRKCAENDKSFPVSRPPLNWVRVFMRICVCVYECKRWGLGWWVPLHPHIPPNCRHVCSHKCFPFPFFLLKKLRIVCSCVLSLSYGNDCCHLLTSKSNNLKSRNEKCHQHNNSSSKRELWGTESRTNSQTTYGDSRRQHRHWLTANSPW